MYSLIYKLKHLKVALRNLNKEGFTDVQASATKAYQELMQIQAAMHNTLSDVDIQVKERDLTYK